MNKFNDGRDWFFKKRYAMFIHWGLYSIPAWHEQIIWRGNILRQDYELLMDQFNPENFDPDAWLDTIQEVGMESVCFTTKHHDGFCMWDTKYSDYNIMNTPYGKDIVGMLANACHKRGMPFGIYYSIPDWHHHNYPNQGRHHEMFGPRKGDQPDIKMYLEYVRNQMEELCSNYGEISQIFWDVNVLDFDDPSVNDMIRRLQPNAVINDRGPDKGDFETPERNVPDLVEFRRLTQAVQSLGRESWGYRIDEDYYNYKYLMQSIDRVMAMGGQYQLNVGPKSDGTFAEEDMLALKRIGKWYNSVKEAFIETVPATTILRPNGEPAERDDVLITKKGNILYAHLYNDLQTNSLVLKR